MTGAAILMSAGILCSGLMYIGLGLRGIADQMRRDRDERAHQWLSDRSRR